MNGDFRKIGPPSSCESLSKIKPHLVPLLAIRILISNSVVEPQLFFTVPVPVPTFEKLLFRFQLLKSYGSGSGSGSYFWKVTVPAPAPVPAPYLDHKRKFFKQNFGNFFAFFLGKVFYKENVYKFQQFFCKMGMKKMLNEENQIHNFICSSGSGTVINYGSGSGSDFLTSYGSGSTSQKVMVPTVPVPVPQRWFPTWPWNSSRRKDRKNAVYLHWSQQRHRHHRAVAYREKQHSDRKNFAAPLATGFQICS